ncbi:hypothetical protein [Kribbia dieselivorans]|uniref:hypothetical protein n=1 Tax=Kribbia dieselivorans TaxID=331526 RepID=UPI0008383BD0|nr:hypothetical protein [Kribbia dieselivorans]
MTNPCLPAHLRVLRRADGAVQLGLDTPDALVIEGVTDAEHGWLELMDGTRDRTTLLSAAGAQGITAGRALTLLDLLEEHGLLTHPWPGTEPRGRAGAHVLIDGAGAAAAMLADVLRHAGVGHVDHGPGSADAHLAATSRLPHLVVLTDTGPVPPDRARPWRDRDVAHLPVALRSAQAIVGPVVVPGVGPCLECVEWARTDLDPSWPWLRAQVSPTGIGPAVRVQGDTALRSLVTGLSAMAVLTQLDRGDPTNGLVAVGSAVQIRLPGPEIERLDWAAHPSCRACGRVRATFPASVGRMTG